MEKKKYEYSQLEIVLLDKMDVIATSVLDWGDNSNVDSDGWT